MVEPVLVARGAMAAMTGIVLVWLGVILYASGPKRESSSEHLLDTRYMIAMLLLVLGIKRFVTASTFTVVNTIDPPDMNVLTRALDGPMQIAQWFVIAGILFILPRRPSWGSPHGLMYMAFGGWVIIGVLLWFFNGSMYWEGWRLGEPPDGGRPTLFSWFLIRYGGIHLILLILMLSTLIRVSRIPDKGEMHSIRNLIPFLFAIPFWNLGRGLLAKIELWNEGRLMNYVTDRQNVPGDCCDIAVGTSIAVEIMTLGIAIYLILRGAYAVLVPLVIGLISWVLVDDLGFSTWSLVWVFPIVGVLVIMGNRGYAGGVDPGPRGSLLFSGAMFVLTYIFVNLFLFSMAPDWMFTFPVATLAGAVLGATVAVVTHPRGREWLARLGDSTLALVGDRVEAYRSALESEVETGATPEEVSERLRPLRSRLGISEREHAVIDHMVRDSLETGKSAPRLLEEGTTFLGRYRVIEPLGMGGGGRVYLCHDERLDREVVLKELKRQDSHDNNADLVREAKAFAKVHHPNVITLYDVEEVGDRAVLVMEHASGGSLSDRLKEGPLTETQVVRLAEDLLGGLSAVHEKKLVHRDVKPSNVLTDQDGSFKLGDFGVAHLPGFETTAFGFGDWENPVGTVRYMSPEQARGAPVGPSSDLYSAAVTIYEALTGTPYVNVQASQTPVEVQMAVASTKSFQHDLGDHKHLRRWFERALAASPEGRFKHAHEMLEALKTSARGEAEQ